MGIIIKIQKKNTDLLFHIFTYTKYPVNNWIVATVAHCQPMTAKEYDIDVAISEIELKMLLAS